MRAVLAIALVACGGYRTREPAHIARPGCAVDGTLVTTSGTTTPDADDAPIAIAYVHHSFTGSDVLAVWADGSVVMREGREMRQGAVAPEAARRIAQEIAVGLARSPDYAELSGPTDMPRVELLARDGTRWRHAFLWGAGPTSYDDAPDGFRAAYRALLSLQPSATNAVSPHEFRGQPIIENVVRCAMRRY